MTSSPIASSASDRSTGGASGSGPSTYGVYRDRRVSRRLALAIDRLATPRLLADLARQVQALQGELDGTGPLAVFRGAEPCADLVVQLGLPQRGQAGQHVPGRDLLAGGHDRPTLDRGDQEPEVDAPEVRADGLRGRRAQQVVEDLVLVALLA